MAKEDKFIASKNKTQLRSDVKDAFDTETALYETFFNKITEHAKTHKQVTINNLNQVETRLRHLKNEVSTLKDSILFHDEEVVVNRSKIIRNTENSTHDQNESILHYDRMNADEIINAVDYLSKALVTVKKDFFDFYQHAYLGNILANTEYYDFFTAKSLSIQSIFISHQEAIYRMFTELDDEIKFMDENISRILKEKNRKMLEINAFYEEELSHFSDNQLSYSAESDPTSIEIQALTSDKINQFNAYKDHQIYQNIQIKELLHNEYLALFNHIYQRLLRTQSYEWIETYDFFDHPDVYLEQLKSEALELERYAKDKELAILLKRIARLEHWPAVKKSLESKAHKMLNKQMREKIRLIVFNEKYSARQISKMELALDEYLTIMRIDPFLAQSIGDENSTFIKDERVFLSVLKVNKELKANINYDIQTAKIKSEINTLETDLRYSVRKAMFKQEIDLLSEVYQINEFLLSMSLKRGISKLTILKERAMIERLDKATNEHLAFMIESLNTNRMWLSLVSQALIDAVRSKETHNIYVTEAKSRIDYVLKQYEMKSLHFKAMYENEMNYLVMQKTRIDKESLIHNEFVLTTYLNQMRFAEEQLKLAETEYRLRLEAITETIDDERSYHHEMIETTKNRYLDQIKIIKNEYEAYYYQDSRQLEFTSDDKKRKSVMMKIEKETKSRDQKINTLVGNMTDDVIILRSEADLKQLDEYLRESIDAATELKDDTIAEFTELYNSARERYEVLKPYLESSINILDPSFYDQLERINNRVAFQLKKAEMQLDIDTKELLDRYLEIYFHGNEEIDKTDYSELLEGIGNSRDQTASRYSVQLQNIEAAYLVKSSDLAKEEESMRKEAELLKSNWKVKYDASVSQIKQSLILVDQEFAAQVETDRIKTEKAVGLLSSEYRLAIKKHRQFTDGVAFEFDKLIQTYKPYMKLAKKEIDYRKTVKPLIVKHRIKLKKSLRNIELTYHSYKITSASEMTKKSPIL